MDLLARFIGIWMVFIIYIAVCVEGVAYGGACSIGGECTDVNTECDTGITDTCICTTYSFLSSNTQQCVLKIALHATCVTGEPADQCLDVLAECDATSLVCRCNDAYFENKDGICAPQVPLNAACDVTDPTTDQCSEANSECRDDGTGNKCLCSTTHYDNGAACLFRLYPEVNCSGDQCVSDATCVSIICKCNAGFNASPANSPTACIQSGDVKVMIQQNIYALPIIVTMMFSLL